MGQQIRRGVAAATPEETIAFFSLSEETWDRLSVGECARLAESAYALKAIFTAREAKPEDKLASAKSQGQAQFDSILEMVQTLQRIRADTERYGERYKEDGRTLEDAEQAIHEDALSVEVRSDWHAPGEQALGGNGEYCILLCTGGPAVRVVGELTCGEPETARMEVQDWFTPWVEFRPIADKAEHAKDKFSGYDSEPILLDYARCFWFGE